MYVYIIFISQQWQSLLIFGQSPTNVIDKSPQLVNPLFEFSFKCGKSNKLPGFISRL